MPLIIFKCKHCFKPFNTREDAVLCEKAHLKVKKAKEIKYVVGPYPLTIEVMFSDGSNQVYIREADTFSMYGKV